VLLSGVCEVGGHPLADHLWVLEPLRFQTGGIAPGMRVRFRARVSAYQRGDGSLDYGLTKVHGVRCA